jgi:ArsR family transcriptional regulator
MDLIRLTKVLKALSDPTRLEIVALLSFRPHCVCELVNIIGFSQPTISRHLQVLTDARITSFEKSKFFIIYKLSPKDEFTYKILDTLLEELKKTRLIR